MRSEARSFAVATSAVLAVFIAALLAGCPQPGSGPVPGRATPEPSPTPRPTPVPLPTPEPTPTPTPTPYVPNKTMVTAKMFNGMEVRTTLETSFGGTATKERNDTSSYVLDLQLRIRVPKAHQSLEELQRLNPKLSVVLPGLAGMLPTARVAASFDELYRLKVSNLRNNLSRLDSLLSRHNFYDCETVLELQEPLTKRKALLVQSDMDVDTDGSDGDRVSLLNTGGSSTFQPFTSYSWPKRTKNPSPALLGREDKLRQMEVESRSPGLTPQRVTELRNAMTELRREIADLKNSSFLVGAFDPFIVLPGSMFKSRSPHAPSVGDYCVVIHQDRLLPGIVGDVGPTYKTGEASLRLCKEINPAATGNSRATNDLRITYLVFPGTAEKPFTAPDYAKWKTKCEGYLRELGGFTGELFAWPDTTRPPMTPVPLTPPPASPAPTSLAPATPATPSPQLPR